jgi:superfamily I DNA/RNA helicase
MSFQPSKYQQAIFDWIERGEGHAVIEAVAGSGKTTTAVQAMRLIPRERRVIFLAFSKAIAQELSERIPRHCEASTLNSLGHRAWCRFAGRVRLDVSKTDAIMASALTEAEVKRWGSVIKRLVDVAKASGVAPADMRGVQGLLPDDPHVWGEMISHYDIDLRLEFMTREKAKEAQLGCIELARRVLRLSIEATHTIDFNDQLYLPVLYGVSLPKYDWIFVDEAQDLSPIQQRLVEMAIGEKGRIVAIGDSRQAIYGFRGADAASMRNFRERLGAVELPLSICYRCPKSHIERAKEFVPQLEAAPGALRGEVQDFGDKWDASVFSNQDIIICRASAPLVRAAFKILSQKVAVRILGRDLGKGIVALIRKLKAFNQLELSEKLNAWRDREIAKMQAKDPEANTDRIDDKADTVEAFMEMFPEASPEMLCREVEKLYSDETGGILTLSTVHRAKGLEAHRVFILNEWMMPLKAAKRPWQQEQERNLQYVAYTRAKSFLGFIEIKRRGP